MKIQKDPKAGSRSIDSEFLKLSAFIMFKKQEMQIEHRLQNVGK